MNQTVQIAALLVQLKERLVREVLLVRGLGCENHAEAGAKSVLAQVRKLQLQ